MTDVESPPGGRADSGLADSGLELTTAGFARAGFPGPGFGPDGVTGGPALSDRLTALARITQIGSAPYSVTKHAALAFAEWLAITYGDQGLVVSALCPQAVESKMTAGVEAILIVSGRPSGNSR